MYFKSIKPIRTQEPVHIENCLESADKAAAVSILTQLKLKTTLGRELSFQEKDLARNLVRKMAAKGWLSAEDMKWCNANVALSI